MNLEQKTSQTVLEKPLLIRVGKRAYDVPQPTTATLIRISEIISTLPERKLDGKRISEESLSIAKDCRQIGEIIAIVIMGEKRRWSPLRRIRFAWLSRRIITEMTPSQITNALAKALGNMQLADFFALTTFLTEINMLKATKVEN